MAIKMVKPMKCYFMGFSVGDADGTRTHGLLSDKQGLEKYRIYSGWHFFAL
jgi:hypothetical protein